MQEKSFFTKILKTVSNLPWLKSTLDSSVKEKEQVEQTPFADVSSVLTELTEAEFEKLLHKIFSQRGYSINQNEDPGHANVDLVLMQNSEISYVHYQNWREQQIDEAIVSEFYSVVKEKKLKQGIIISSGNFSEEALGFSLGKKLLLINGTDLSHMIGVLMQSLAEGNPDESAEVTKNESEPAPAMPEIEPLCPLCNNKMIKRTAKKGRNAGNIFWGCSQFPNCRGVVSGKE